MDLNAMKTWLTLRSNALLCLIQAVIPGKMYSWYSWKKSCFVEVSFVVNSSNVMLQDPVFLEP